jgi:hypothetical protein
MHPSKTSWKLGPTYSYIVCVYELADELLQKDQIVKLI